MNFCLKHNAVKAGKYWVFPGEKVEELIKKENKPAFLVRCPLCMHEDKEERKFFKGE